MPAIKRKKQANGSRQISHEAVTIFRWARSIVEAGDDAEWEPAGRRRELDGSNNGGFLLARR
jgi:hypothetical protein